MRPRPDVEAPGTVAAARAQDEGQERAGIVDDGGGGDKRPLHSSLHRVGAGLSVRFAYVDGRLDATWHPRLPTRREMRRVVDRYRAARDGFLVQIAESTGRSMAVLEVPLT